MFLRTAAPGGLVSLSLGAQVRRMKPVTQAEVERLTREAIPTHTHDAVPSKTVNGYDIATANKGGQTDLARMKGFVAAEFFAVYVGAEDVNGTHSANRALAMINTVATDVIAKHPGKFVFATTADDVGRTPAIDMVMTAAAG